MTWTRARPQMNTHSIRVHISRERVSQPLEFGGLSIPHPVNQHKSLMLSWARKFLQNDARLVWVQYVQNMLIQKNRPSLIEHVKLGSIEWDITADAIFSLSEYWSYVFKCIAEFIALSHEHEKNWIYIPILGYEELGHETTISSLHYRNPAARQIFNSGLTTIGQLYECNDAGLVVHNRRIPFQDMELRFNITFSVMMKNVIDGLCNKVQTRFRANMFVDSTG